MNRSSIVIDLRIIELQMNALIEILERQVELAFFAVGIAAIAIRQRPFGRDGDGPREIGDGPVIIAADVISVAAIDIGIEQLRIEFQGTIEILDRAVVEADRQVKQPAVERRISILWLKLDSLGEVSNTFSGLALLVQHDAAIEIRGCVARIELDGYRVIVDRLREGVLGCVSDGAIVMGRALSFKTSAAV